MSYNKESRPGKIEIRESNILFKPNADISSEAEDSETNRYPAEVERDNITNDPTISKVRAVILLVALSFHMVFDGLALGLLDKDSKEWTLLLALCVHKVLVFLSIGLETCELFKSLCKSVSILLCFASVSPLGIIIGITVTSSGDELSQSAATAILQSVATGTFIYVTFFEILYQEYEDARPDLLKVVCTVMGCAVVGAAKLLEDVDL